MRAVILGTRSSLAHAIDAVVIQKGRSQFALLRRRSHRVHTWRLDYEKKSVATMILCWEALGFALAYRKGQLGTSVVWIGGKLEFNSKGIQASIKETIIEDIVEALQRYKTTNVIEPKDLQSFVGRANHAAGLLVTVRPFLHAIWKAMSASGNSPGHTIWCKQIDHALHWLRCFFMNGAPGITRQFSLDEFRGCGPNFRWAQ